MTAGGLPTIQVLLDDGSGTFPYDISTYVRLADGIDISRGRDDEVSDVSPGQCSFTLDNADGRFTVGSTLIASPSPIRADQRVRVKYTANASTVNRHTGYMESLPVVWPNAGDNEARVRVQLFDAQAQAERRVLRSVVEEEIMADSPTAYYTLSEPAESTYAVDSSGNQPPNLVMTGTGAVVTFGSATGPSTDSLTAATFASGQVLAMPNPAAATSDKTILVAFNCSTITGSLQPIVRAWQSIFTTSTLLGISSAGHLVYAVDTAGLTSPNVVTDGATHVAAAVYSPPGTVTLYIDGVAVTGTSIDTAVWANYILGTAYTGSLAHFASFSTALSGAQIAAISTAMLTGFAGESDTARLTRLAGYAGVPVGTLDTSLTNVAFEDFTGTSAAAEMRNVINAAVGVGFIDGSGNQTMHNRNRAPLKVTPDITIAAEFLAEATSFAYDMQGIINYFETTATATGVIQVARNAISENGDGTATNPKHGRYPTSQTYLVSTDAEALDRANWIVANHAQPTPRMGTLVLDLLTMTAANQAAALAIEADTWVRITGLPSQAPTGTTADFVVQGLADHLEQTSTGAAWTLTLNVVSQSLFDPWVLDDSVRSVLDSTTQLFV